MFKNFFGRFNRKWRYEFNKQFKPEIIGGYRRLDGVFLKNTRISNVTHISHPHNFLVEDHVFIGHFNYIDCYNKVSIGVGTQVTNFVSILTHSSHDSLRLYGEHYVNAKEISGLKTGSVTIGDYTYIGAQSIIMPGSKLGKGTLVSAFSYVDGEFADYAILRGIPAQVVGSTKERDEKLLREFPELKAFYYNSQG